MGAFLVESVVRGFHVYQEVWHATAGEELPCRRDLGNPHDPYAVAMVRVSSTVGHVPRKISSICSIFLRRGGTITCTVTGSRQHSGDLPQGGLEVPCVLKFEGKEKELTKAEKLIKLALASASSQNGAPEDKTKPPAKPGNKSPADTGDGLPTYQSEANKSPHEHLPESKRKKLSVIAGEQLCEVENNISKGDLLSDLPINFAQQLLHSQFPHIEGLQSTLLQSRTNPSAVVKNKLQIVHSRGNHWIVVSSIGCDNGAVNVYDSIYKEIDASTQKVVSNMFGRVKLNLVPVQKQKGGTDCGLFAIAFSTAICKELDPTTITFNQTAMRDHLIYCLKNGTMTLFPTL